MFRFQLEVAVALVISTFASLVVRYFTGKGAEGSIQLPARIEGEDQDNTHHDPFDVTRPEDVVHGYPIDADGFWTNMRRRKLLISCLLALAVIISSILLGWSIADELREESIVYSLHVVFAFYLFLLGTCSVRQEDMDFHAEYIIHLSVLSTLGVLLLGGTVILPESPPPSKASNLAFKNLFPPSTGEALTQDSDVILRALWHSLVLVYTFSWILITRTPLGPPLHYPASNIYSEKIVKSITNKDENNVCGIINGSPWDILMFSYTTKVIWLGNTAESLDIGDLPIVPADMRSTFNYAGMRRVLRTVSLRFFSWNPRPGSGWQLSWQLIRLNSLVLTAEISLAVISAILVYIPPYFLQRLVAYLEVDPKREETGWGWVYVIGLFVTNATTFLITGQLWSLASTTVQGRIRIQLNSVLFAKTLVRKDIASSSPPQTAKSGEKGAESVAGSEKKGDENEFSSKAQIMTLMTTDVDRVSDFAWHLFSLVDPPIELVIGTLFLYQLLGVSCLFGFAALFLFLPVNHFASKVVLRAQDKLMKARDERIALMNEILGAIRMVKFMAWERSFEKRVLTIRGKELKYQQLNNAIGVLLTAIWNGAPILVTLVSFWHFVMVRHQSLTPSIAFTSILVYREMQYAFSALPETFISMLQSFVSLRRIEKYLNGAEVSSVPPLDQQSKIMAFQSCTVTWPQERASTSQVPSAAVTPEHKFLLSDLNLNFPRGGLSLVCGKLGSGKTLLLLALLGEADVLAGQVLCPRSPPDSLSPFASVEPNRKDWVVEGLCAYVPQAAWLRNASIKENILFNLPCDEDRYAKTLEVCALISDLEILEDGDESEIGERGVNLSGGQKARVSLARAVYSRASILLLDDVLSAVDAHTAHHLYNECLKGELMEGRTVILVSHHVQMCASGAGYIVVLDNGRVQFHGSQDDFYGSGIIHTLTQSTQHQETNDKIENMSAESSQTQTLIAEEDRSESSSTVVATVKADKKPARKLVEEEKRAVGRISRDIWETYVWACGPVWYWIIFIVVFQLASLGPLLKNGWLKHWSNSELNDAVENPGYYIGVYAILSTLGLVIGTFRWFVLYGGSIRASHVLYRRLLEAVLFANIRFHDTVSRGRLLNRFGKDFEGIDSSLCAQLGTSAMYGLSGAATIITVSVVGGPPFICAAAILGIVYWNAAKVYGQPTRDMRRLDSVTRSPLYSIYGETISGVPILRAFGASSKVLRDMLRCVDTNSNPYYWIWGLNRWLSVRFNLLSAGMVGATGLACIITPGITASTAGFALALAFNITHELQFMVRTFVRLEQSMVAVERVKEYTDLKRESPEFMELRPDPAWPSRGEIKCENLVIRYAPELPDVLHHLNFEVRPGEKIGILGRTGSGKSTLALSFFRFVEATKGRIVIDGIDISTIGLADLRSRLTIIPQDPIILSGTLRSTLDVFDEYQDAEIYEALRRVHLIPSEDAPGSSEESSNVNVFRDLDSSVSEGGENFSTGEKQLLCMARAILKRSKVLLMDEATASVDYATDELIGRTIRQEFAESTILTIAHRLRTVIDYDRVLLLEQGCIVEFDKPSSLLGNPSSKFTALCKATGRHEYATLKKLAGISD